MELTQNGLLEEILAPKGDSWTTFHGGSVNEIFPSCNGWNSQSFDDHNPNLATSNFSSVLGLISPSESSFAFDAFGEPYPLVHDLAEIPEYGYTYDLPPITIQEEFDGMAEDGQVGLIGNGLHGFIDGKGCYKVEIEQTRASMDASTTGLCGEKKNKMKKVEGQPSKNLMAERRRRKRLNDRLSMLRSIVPKISKTDRTSILGDAIDYMKELLDKIRKLRGENIDEDTNQMNKQARSKQLSPNEVLVRNPPKFDVERRNLDTTRIEIHCAAKPGLLLSTLGTLEALGLDIQQCVISCFNDLSVQATCSEALEHRGLISSEDIKQALFRNAGYGGRCL